ncbi:replication protein RepA [Paludibacterium yongneupense]|uniref:replication protein RepA n=1 Tax=Paludibacterium yongneupense TaxID=400061 RepID=UPI0009FD0C09|nr:replication protein RepA [Paludibacterium yongneupense]
MRDIQEDRYRSQLIDKGVPFAQAAEIARRTTGAQISPQPGTKHQRAIAQPTPFQDIEQPKGSKRLSAQAEKLIRAAAEISLKHPTGKDMAFTHAIFCQVGLPRKMVNAREFLRKSGTAWLNVQAGYLDEGAGPVPQPLPYGALPRLALAHVSTYAVRHKTREIFIGDSAAQFLELMGMDQDGRRYSALRKQMHALAACRLQLGISGRTFNGQAVEQFDAWLANRNTRQRALWPGLMILTEHFYNSLLEGAVPLDIRALHALKGSALALDVYTWLAHRLHRIEGRGPILHWASLREQFAQEYTGSEADKNFKDAFLPQLKKVLAVYPQAKVQTVRGGLLLRGSPPPIPPKGR